MFDLWTYPIYRLLEKRLQELYKQASQVESALQQRTRSIEALETAIHRTQDKIFR